jgi:hypothetical protein
VGADFATEELHRRDSDIACRLVRPRPRRAAATIVSVPSRCTEWLTSGARRSSSKRASRARRTSRSAVPGGVVLGVMLDPAREWRSVRQRARTARVGTPTRTARRPREVAICEQCDRCVTLTQCDASASAAGTRHRGAGRHRPPESPEREHRTGRWRPAAPGSSGHRASPQSAPTLKAPRGCEDRWPRCPATPERNTPSLALEASPRQPLPRSEARYTTRVGTPTSGQSRRRGSGFCDSTTFSRIP